jgi:hypothetical protein
VLSFLLRFTDSDYTFGIFKLFLIIYIVFLRYLPTDVISTSMGTSRNPGSIKLGKESSVKHLGDRKSKKERQHNGQKKKEKRTNNDLQNITQKTKDRAT